MEKHGKLINNNRLKTPWDDKLKLPDGSYSVSDIQDYFQNVILDFLTPEARKLLESAKNKIIKDKNGENIPHIEIKEVVLVHLFINQIIEFFIHLFQKNHFLIY